MVSFWRFSLASTLAFSLFMTSIPLHAAKAMTASDQWEEIKDIMELSVPVRKDETFAETYYRMETRLAPSQKREFAELNKKLDYKLGKTKAVSAQVKEDSIVLKDGAQEMVIKLQKNKDDELYISVNGKALSPEQAQSPLKTYEFLNKLSAPAPDKKSAWLWHILVPESQAFAFTWPLIIAGTLVVGGLGYLAYKKFFKKEKTCKDKEPVCCNQNATLVQLDNGCCTESGGLESGFKTCPTPLYIDGGSNTGTTTESGTSTGTQ